LREEAGVDLSMVVRTDSAVRSRGEIAGDLTDAQFVPDLFQSHEFDTVIHAAAPPYNPAAYRTRQFETFERDLTGFLRVLAAAQSVSKIVYLSSATVYENCQEFPFRESCTDRCAPPSSPVGLAKATGERAIKLWSAQTGNRFTIWRLFNVVSPLEPHDVPGAHVQIDFYRKLLVERQPELEILGSGAQVRCFTWVEDVANAIVDYLRDPRTDN
jgi:nucleoside-diphosphate-sugar epimerase